MEGRAGSSSARPDEWGPAVASGDATKLAELVLLWSGLKPERALSILRDCVSLLEKEVALSTLGSSSRLATPTTPGRASSSCLSALIVALNETCDGTSWYTSTKELQLTSLEFCTACRNYPTVHLTVNTETPRRMLAAADIPPPHPSRLGWTRVPRIRARRVTWNIQTEEELRTPIFALTDVDYLEFGRAFEGSLDAVVWLRRLKTIEFQWESPFNGPIHLVKWPACLQRLVFGGEFNQQIEHVKFPASLQHLSFGSYFNQPIEGVLWPSSLKVLILGCFAFNKPVERVAWPTSLRQLTFGGGFNQPIERVAWPTSLRQLTFGVGFNQPIERATFSASLQRLTFGQQFDQPIERVEWPDSLQVLIFGENFNQPVDNVRWPASLQELTFGDYLELPDDRMGMNSSFNQYISYSVWPASLRRITLGGFFRQSLQGLGTWMPNLEALRILEWDIDNIPKESLLVRGIEWPNGLRELTVFKESILDGVVIPSTVQVYRPYLYV
ncbi:unnamed protein product [Ectocarpus sp. 12 AP-2014]